MCFALLFNIVLECLAIALSQERNKRHNGQKGRSKTTLFIEDMFM